MATKTSRGGGTRSCWTESYALRHCDGFRVLGPKGLVGYVEQVRLDDLDEASVLVVAGARRLHVPVGEVASVDVDRELVRLIRVPR